MPVLLKSQLPAVTDEERPHLKPSRAAAETSRQPPGESAHADGPRNLHVLCSREIPTAELRACACSSATVIPISCAEDQLCVFFIPDASDSRHQPCCNQTRALRFRGRRCTPCQVSLQLTRCLASIHAPVLGPLGYTVVMITNSSLPVCLL